MENFIYTYLVWLQLWSLLVMEGSWYFYKYRRFIKWLGLYLALAGPGIIVMVADNDTGGITTYAATGAKFGFN